MLVHMFPAELSLVSVFNTKQLRERGVAPSDLRRAISDGKVIRLKRGWYTNVVGEHAADQHRLRVLAELRDHPGTVASHHSGAALLRLPVHRPDWTRVHLMRTGPGLAQNRAGVVIHQRVGDAASCDPALVVAQTALFCPVSGLMALDHALRNKTVRLRDFDHWAKALEAHAGRAHLRVVRRLCDDLHESPLESRTTYVLDCWGWTMQPQFEVPGTPHRVDGRLKGTRVLVECDGKGKYDEPGASVREKVREDDLRALNWQVVRVTTELLDERSTLALRVRNAVEMDRRFSALAG